MVVIADPGDALFASSELVIHRQTEFISPAYYTSMGFAVPAALGAMVARPKLRPMVLVGDGAFQMTGMELSTIVRHGFNPDRHRAGQPGLRHRTATPCRASTSSTTSSRGTITGCPEMLGGGRGYEVRTEGDFDHALKIRPGRHRTDEHPPRPSGRERLQPDARTAGAKAARPRVGQARSA